MAKKRILWIDIIKVLACFLVIINHSGDYIFYYSNSTATTIFYIINFVLCKIGVPLFIMCSGALFLGRKLEYKKIFIQISKVIVPLVGLSFIIYFKQNGFNVIGFIEKFFEEPIIIPYWYLYMIIMLYLITPFLNKMIENFNKKDYLYFILIVVLVPAIIDVFRTLFNLDISGYFTMASFPIIIGVYIIGKFLTTLEIKKKYAIISSLLFVFTSLMFFIITYLMTKQANQISYAFDNAFSLFTILESSCLFYLVKYLFYNKDNRIISTISECTFGIYLLHFLIIYKVMNLNIVTYVFNFNIYIGMYFGELLVFVLCFIVTYILKKIPIIKKFL